LRLYHIGTPRSQLLPTSRAAAAKHARVADAKRLALASCGADALDLAQVALYVFGALFYVSLSSGRPDVEF
jgi:hypothetical protein